jgi:hypothetical protein
MDLEERRSPGFERKFGTGGIYHAPLELYLTRRRS